MDNVKLLSKFGVNKPIDLNFVDYKLAGGFLNEKDFNKIFLAPKEPKKKVTRKRKK